MADWKNRIKETRTVRVEDIQPHPSNWRRHPQAQESAIRGLLAQVGIVAPVVAYESELYGGLVLLDGHLRQETGGEWPVVVLDVSDAEADIILASFDPITGLAEMDATALAELLGRVDMQAIEDDGLVGLLEELATASGAGGDAGEPVDAEPQIDRAEELRQKWAVEPGDLWLLDSGKGHAHRLICGDCTDADVVRRVMDGERAFMMVTDPPYGVEYDQEWRSSNRVGKVKNDDRCSWQESYRLGNADIAYVWHASLHADVFKVDLEAAGYEIRAQIIWVKNRMVFSQGHYHWKHEPCWYGVRKEATARWTGDRTQTTVWQMDIDGDVEGGHSTQKPLECMARPIRNHGRVGDIVYEPFCGSGTTIIAAENLGRRCYAVEISPAYVAVALERFANATGSAPVRIENAPAEAEAVEA